MRNASSDPDFRAMAVQRHLQIRWQIVAVLRIALPMVYASEIPRPPHCSANRECLDFAIPSRVPNFVPVDTCKLVPYTSEVADPQRFIDFVGTFSNSAGWLALFHGIAHCLHAAPGEMAWHLTPTV